jgi:DNA-directed RNA polymerase subunit RPC12/RpoP
MPFKNEAERKAYMKEYHAKWYKENKEKRTAQITEYKKSKPDEWRKAIGQKFHLRTRYNITPKQYEAKLISQNYCCAICGKDVIDNIRNGAPVALSVDHCHKSEKLRDLLCHQCNSFLGHAKDNIEILQRAIDYLHKHML